MYPSKNKPPKPIVNFKRFMIWKKKKKNGGSGSVPSLGLPEIVTDEKRTTE
jgi:hypothetical protein